MNEDTQIRTELAKVFADRNKPFYDAAKHAIVFAAHCVAASKHMGVFKKGTEEDVLNLYTKLFLDEVENFEEFLREKEVPKDLNIFRNRPH